jgi:class 3 adenylate cyclase
MAEQIAERNTRIHEKTEEYEKLLRNIYPELVAERVKLGHTSISEVVRNVSIMVLNIDGVNALFESTQHDTVLIMNAIIDAFDEAATRHGIEKLKSVGESYIAACGLTSPRLDHAARAVAFAEEACRILDRLRRGWNLPLALRAGIASGEVEAGLIGRQRTVYDLWGVTMLIARRIVFEAGPYAIRITAATHDLLGDDTGFRTMPPITNASLGEIETFERPALAEAAQAV